jgi:hypothetical protein
MGMCLVMPVPLAHAQPASDAVDTPKASAEIVLDLAKPDLNAAGQRPRN